MSSRLVQIITVLLVLLIIAGGIAVVGEAASSSLVCPSFTRPLGYDSKGNDVAQLQEFLSQDPSVYPEAQVSGYFGRLTEAAVKRWQVKFNILGSDSTRTTQWGIVDARTASAMQEQCSGAAGVASYAAPSVGGLMVASPVSGNGPLPVVIQATVNTPNVCGGAVYDVDYGDGTIQSQIIVPSTYCRQMTKALSHTYLNKGVYNVTLSAGEHRAVVTVQVF